MGEVFLRKDSEKHLISRTEISEKSVQHKRRKDSEVIEKFGFSAREMEKREYKRNRKEIPSKENRARWWHLT